MFVIKANSTQTLSINISNEYSLDYFLFALSGNGLESEKLFFADPNYSKIPRAVSFEIEENATEDLMNGVISIPRAGDLYCAIYNVGEKTLELPETEPIWRGLFRVYEGSTTINENTIERKYYGYEPK
jgi:hypothetical protein